MRRPIRTLVVGCIAAGLSSTSLGCSRESAKGGTVMLLVKTADNSFFDGIIQGARDEVIAGGDGLELAVRAGAREGDVTSQREILQAAYVQYVLQSRSSAFKGLLLTPSGSKAELVAEIKRLNTAGVPVVLLDTRIDSVELSSQDARIDSYIGSDNREGGRLAARVVAAIPGVRRVLVLNGVDGQETASARRAGFTEVAATRQLQLTERTCNWRRDEARVAVSALLAGGAEFDAVFAANDEMALGARMAFDNAGRGTNTPIVGFDGTAEAVASIKGGALFATVAQDPVGMGRLGVQTLRILMSGRRVEISQQVPLKVITKDSIK